MWYCYQSLPSGRWGLITQQGFATEIAAKMWLLSNTAMLLTPTTANNSETNDYRILYLDGDIEQVPAEIEAVKPAPAPANLNQVVKELRTGDFSNWQVEDITGPLPPGVKPGKNLK